LVCTKKNFHIQIVLLTTRLEMLRANGIVPRNPTLDTPPPPETSSGKGEHSKLKEEVESEFETDDEDDMREKALLVRTVRFYLSY
jgi:hypothetical protein